MEGGAGVNFWRCSPYTFLQHIHVARGLLSGLRLRRFLWSIRHTLSHLAKKEASCSCIHICDAVSFMSLKLILPIEV